LGLAGEFVCCRVRSYHYYKFHASNVYIDITFCHYELPRFDLSIYDSTELGIIDSKYAPKSAAAGPGGAVVYWHVDDVAATFEKVKAMGAKEYEPLTSRGEAGFITASVVDPFGNILGIMYNPHYLEILGSTKREN
jgi:predicted enzyme related to lactoylglutathione lyase